MNAEIKAAIEATWHSRAAAQMLKPRSMAYKRAEGEFFTGAIAAINALCPNADPTKLSNDVPPIWVINALSGMPITEVRGK